MKERVEFQLVGAGARGRSGWFKPVRAVVRRDGSRVTLDVWSRVEGGLPPIILTLAPEDASALADALREVASCAGPATRGG